MDEMRRRARAARVAAEEAASVEIDDWYRKERNPIEADETLTAAEKTSARRTLVLEVGRRAKRAFANARRDNSLAKTIERELLDRYDSRHASPDADLR